MLQKLRDKTSGWIATLVLGLLIIPFAFVGVNEYMGGGTANDVATVEAPPTWWKGAPHWWPMSMLWQRKEVTMDEFRTTFEIVRQQQRDEKKEEFDPREFESKENKLKVLEQLINQRVLSLASERAGVVIGDEAVRKAIVENPDFQVDGKFDTARYQLQLSARGGMTPLKYEQQERERLKMLLIPEGIASSEFVVARELERLFKLLAQTRDVEIALVTPAAADTAPVTDAETQTWYDGHKADYKLPATVTLEYVEVNGAALGKPQPLDEAALRKRYEEEKNRFVSPEQRVVSHILIAAPADADAATLKKAQDKANALMAQARQGADFAALAKANSEDPGSKDSGGQLPAFARDGSMVKPFEDAAFALQKPGDIQGPVKSDFGYHVLKLDEIKPGHGKSFEEVRDELAREQADTDAERAYNDLAGRVVNEVLKNPTTLEPAAKAVGLPVQKLGPFSRVNASGIAANSIVLRNAFSDRLMEDGTVSDAINLGPNHSVFIRVIAHTPEQTQPLAKVREAVIEAVRVDRQHKASAAAADAILARMAKGETLQAIAKADNLRFNEMPGMPRGMPMPDEKGNAAIFAVPRPAEGKVSSGKIALGDGNYAVFAVTKVTDGSVETVPEQQRDGMKQQLVQMGGMSTLEAFIKTMRKQYKVTVMEDRL